MALCASFAPRWHPSRLLQNGKVGRTQLVRTVRSSQLLIICCLPLVIATSFPEVGTRAVHPQPLDSPARL